MTVVDDLIQSDVDMTDRFYIYHGYLQTENLAMYWNRIVRKLTLQSALEMV